MQRAMSDQHHFGAPNLHLQDAMACSFAANEQKSCPFFVRSCT
jgi:hypothetical protein